jgi:pyrroline-5-carboxylate reductase
MESTAKSAPKLLARGKRLGVLGAGVMGQALVQGVLRVGLLPPDRLWAATQHPASAEAAQRDLGIQVVTQFDDLLPETDLLLVCLKPIHIAPALRRLAAGGLRPDALLISIVTGATIEHLEQLVGTSNPWVRAMPNTPCIVGESMTVICGGAHATPEHLARAQALFGAVGKCLPVDENHFNSITALSGSGPAYVYLIIEALADAGVRVGLPRKLALDLVAQTFVGAARMVQSSRRHPAALRDDVTTPAGCTIGGLLMLEDGKIRSVLARAIEEATRIAQRLGPPVQ